ncbi:serine hydrolase [Streptomyces sp. NPDC051162]|uniref:D-alanyl-D-alanine carboxypeptidase n=1 Tax=Streptomyces sp. NPDC051162 TaxID=3154747 RepID=UPI003443FAB1
MAGESPDKSEQRKSSGETTEGERDPRLGVFRESETSAASDARPSKSEETPERADSDEKPPVSPGEDPGKAAVRGGDARLKAAVAAWVADAAVDDAEEPNGAAGAAGTAPGDKKPEPAADRATAVFGAVRPKPDGADGADGDKPANGAGKPAADRATAVFGAVRPKAKDGAEKADGGKPSNGSEKPAEDRATAVFGTLRPKADGEKANADKAGGDKAGGDKPAAASGKSGDGAQKPSWVRVTDGEAKKSEKTDGAGKPAADQATAVFGAVRPKAEDAAGKDAAEKGGAGKPAADQPTAVFGAVKASAKAPAKAAAKTGSDDQPTALIKAPEAPAKAPAKGGSDDQPTALIKAPKAPEAESDSERTSQFVPLKSLDGAAAKSAEKPAIPVSVTPPPAPPKTKPKAPAEPQEPAAPKPGADAAPEQPAAPLDLLAQLTNTPPPAPTPVRSTLRRVKIYAPIVVLLAIIFCVVQAFRPLPAPTLTTAAAKATYTFPGEKFAMPWPDQGQAAAKVAGVGSLGTYGDETPTPTASVAKVMTAYVILKDHPLKKGEKGPDITVDAQAEQDSHAKDESLVTLKQGEKVSEYDLLQMLLIPSGNNAARLLARWDAQSKEAFVAKMNDAAKSLGMTNTTYTDPSGLDETTKSTAVDQLKLAEEVMKDDVFREIVAKPNTNVAGGQHLNNNNDELLIKPGGLGIKTGSSTPAGGTLMWAAKRTINGKENLILGVTMAQHFKGGPDVNAEMSLKLVKKVSYKMIEDVQNALTSAKLVSKGDVVGYVDDGLGGKTPVVATRDLTGVGWPGMTAKLVVGKGGKPVPHSAKAGTEVGELTVGSGPSAMKVPVALKEPLAEPGFGAKLTRLG